MRAAKLAIALLLATVLVASASVALASGRVALVVSNSSYAHIGRLPNPENDAVDLAAALRSAGADVSLVFYAGHGLEMGGVNYVVPVDARLERDTDVRFETVTLDDLLAVMAGASLRLVILDACRNNPLARSTQRTGTTRSVSGGSFGDLNENLLGDETLVAQGDARAQTGPGIMYSDGQGGVLPDNREAVRWFRLSADQGYARGQVRAHQCAGGPVSDEPHSGAGRWTTRNLDLRTATLRLNRLR